MIPGVLAQYNFWDLEKIILCKIHTSLDYNAHFHQSEVYYLANSRNSSSTNFYTYRTKNCTSGIRTNGDRTSGGPPVLISLYLPPSSKRCYICSNQDSAALRLKSSWQDRASQLTQSKTPFPPYFVFLFAQWHQIHVSRISQ